MISSIIDYMLFGLSAQKIARLVSYGVAVILVALPFYEFLVVLVGSHTQHLDLLRIIKEIFICVLFVPALWLAWQHKQLRQWLWRSWVVRLYLIYFALHLITGVWALHNHQVNSVALIYALIINLRFVGFFVLCALVAAMDDFLIMNWLKLVLWPAAAAIIFGLLQRLVLPYDFLKHFGYGPHTIPAYETIDANIKYPRIQSTLRGANPLGAYLVPVISAAVVGLKNQRLKVLYFALAALTMFFTYSRSAWLGLVLALGVLGWLGLGRWRKNAAYAVLALAVILGGSWYIFRNSQSVQKTFLHTSKDSSSRLSSNSQRSSAIRHALSDVVHQPLGRGPGTAGPASYRNNHPARIAENYYLQIAQEVGVAGLVLFLAIDVQVALELWRIRRQPLAQVLLASLVGISFVNLLSHAWTDDTLSLLWWGLAGVALAPVILKGRARHNQNGKTA